MGSVWILLWLGTFLHGAALSGWGSKGTAPLLALLPILMVPVAQRLRPSNPRLRQALGLLAAAAAIAFVQIQILRPWDFKSWVGTGLFTLVGLTSMVLLDPEEAVHPALPLWLGLWLGTAVLDPVVPVLGVGATAFLQAFELWPRTHPAPKTERVLGNAPLWMTLGLVLPKPWWDFAALPQGAWSMACFGLGWALAWGCAARWPQLPLPKGVLWTLLGLLGVLYGPAWAPLWGAFVGGLWGFLLHRTRAATGTDSLPLAFLLGGALSFALHANAWLPGLRHLIWLGN